MYVCLLWDRSSRAILRLDRDMGLMDAIGLQPRHPATSVTSVTSQGTQTAMPPLQNAQTQTDRDPQQPGTSQASHSRAVQGERILRTSSPEPELEQPVETEIHLRRNC